MLNISSCNHHSAEAAVRRPNIILIVADDLGWNDVGFKNKEIRTPNIDGLASQGMLLKHFYVNNVCSPTRAGLMTGQYPIRYGMQQGVCTPRVKHGLPPNLETIAELLERAGYKNRACIGKWHLGHASEVFHPLNQGFTYFYGHYNGAIDYMTHKRCGTLDWHKNKESCYDKGYSTELLSDEAVKFVQRSSEDDAPFFLYLPFNAPHSPMQALEKDLKQYNFDESRPLMKNGSKFMGVRENYPSYGDLGRGNNVRQTFSAMVTSMDRGIGRLLNAIKECQIEKNTVVFFLSDNGGVEKYGGDNSPLKGGKSTLWEGGVRVPAIMSWPGVIKKNEFSGVMGYVDMYATIASMVGLKELKNEQDGVDMWSELKNGQSTTDRFFYLGTNTAIVQKGNDVLKLYRSKQLFNLVKDPLEQKNLIKQYPKIAEKLRGYCTVVQGKAGPKFEVQYDEDLSFPPHEWKMRK